VNGYKKSFSIPEVENSLQKIISQGVIPLKGSRKFRIKIDRGQLIDYDDHRSIIQTIQFFSLQR